MCIVENSENYYDLKFHNAQLTAFGILMSFSLDLPVSIKESVTVFSTSFPREGGKNVSRCSGNKDVFGKCQVE